MKLNDIHEPENKILEEGLLRVIGKVLKYAAIVVGTVLLIGVTKRIFFPEEEKEKIDPQENVKYAYKVVLGMRLELEKSSYLNRIEENFYELSKNIKEQTDAHAMSEEVYTKKHSKTDYSFNTVLWYLDRKNVNRLSKVVDKVNSRYDVDIQILQIKKQRL